MLGLSGGVDSALVAFLAAEALGPESVTGFVMPYRTSNPQSAADAELVAAAIGIRTQTIDITPQIDAYLERFPDASQLRRGNKMARERMSILHELGFTYADVDELLHFMIERRYRHEELLALGFDPKFVQRVEELVTRSQYKRRMPLIAKVSGRSIGHDFRYARDWKQ